MGKRRRAREFALQVLYQLEIAKQNPHKMLAECREHFSVGDEEYEFAEEIVRGITDHSEEIDRLIEQYSEHWRLNRMALTDRNILRIAAFEFLYCRDIPPKVTLNEAIELGKSYGSEESGSFINGILDRIREEAVEKTLR